MEVRNNNIMKRSYRRTAIAVVIVLVATVFGPDDAAAQGSVRAWGMGGASTALATGLAAVEYNPANLAFSDGTTVGLAGAVVDVNNNALTLDRYNEITGSHLDTADKDQLLSEIPTSGFRMDADVRASALGVQKGPFALSFGAFGTGQGNLDKDYFDLVLYGNRMGQTVDFSNTWGEGYAVGTAAISYGREVAAFQGNRLSVGANVRYFHGIYEMHVEDAYGTLRTSQTEISGEAFVSTKSSNGGQGMGLDLGFAMQTNAGWTLGLAIDNLLTRMQWTRSVEQQEFHVIADEINLLNQNLDEAVSDADTTFAAGNYTTQLPRRVRLGAANRFGKFQVAADYIQGLENKGTTSTTPRLNMGLEWQVSSVVQPRIGLAAGGVQGTGASVGLGVTAGFWQIDMAAMTRSGLTPNDTKGLGMALGSTLNF